MAETGFGYTVRFAITEQLHSTFIPTSKLSAVESVLTSNIKAG